MRLEPSTQTTPNSERMASSFRLAIICGVLTAFPAMSIDVGLPAFTNVAHGLGVPVERVSQTLSFFFFGFSTTPLAVGPLSDRVGRRPVLLVACLIYALASVFATLANGFHALLLWRLIQGAGAGAASVLAITVIRDYHQGASARRLLAYAAVVRIIGPTTAPSIGNALLLLGSWRWIYGFMALGGGMMLLMVALALPESLQKRIVPMSRSLDASSTAASRTASGDTVRNRSAFNDYKRFVADRMSRAYTLIIALTFGSHFTYITGSIYVFVNVLHVSNAGFGVLFAIMAVCLMLGSFLSGALSKHKVTGDTILGISLAISVVSTLTMLSLACLHTLGVPVLTLLLSINTTCLGLLTPCAQQGAMEKAGDFAGVASALINAVMTGMGALASYAEGALLAIFHDAPAIVMTGQMALCCCVASIIYLTSVRSR